MQLPGIPMHVVGQDASLLRNWRASIRPTGPTPSTSGPVRRVTCSSTRRRTTPARPSGSDARGSYNVYFFKNRDYRKLSNHGAAGPGGMMTEVRVYQNTLPAQTVVGQTYA